MLFSSVAFSLILILFLEWIGDFLLQSRQIAERKSQEPRALLIHSILLTIPISIAGPIIGLPMIPFIWFLLFNMLIHAAIDWNIWKGYKFYLFYKTKREGGWQNDQEIIDHLKLIKKERLYAEDPIFYAFIGFDRFLHVSTIILLYIGFFK